MKTLFNFLFGLFLLAATPVFAHVDTCCPVAEVDGGEVVLHTQQQQQVAANLIGSWENTLYRFELVSVEGGAEIRRSIEDANLKYVFRKNGEYLQILDGGDITVKSTGKWSLTEDGENLILRSDSTGEAQEIDIKHIVMDELVLGNAFVNNQLGISAQQQDFYFNRF